MAKFHIDLPYVRVSTSASQSISNAVASPYTLPNWNTLDSTDPYGMFDSTNKCFIVPISGYYMFTVGVAFAANATGVRLIAPQVSTTGAAGSYTISYRTQTPATSGSQTKPSYSRLLLLSAGDAVRVSVYQNSGAALSLDLSPDTFMEIRMVGR